MPLTIEDDLDLVEGCEQMRHVERKMHLLIASLMFTLTFCIVDEELNSVQTLNSHAFAKAKMPVANARKSSYKNCVANIFANVEFLGPIKLPNRKQIVAKDCVKAKTEVAKALQKPCESKPGLYIIHKNQKRICGFRSCSDDAKDISRWCIPRSSRIHLSLILCNHRHVIGTFQFSLS